MLSAAERSTSAASTCDYESEDATSSTSVISLAEEFDYELVGYRFDIRNPKVSTEPGPECVVEARDTSHEKESLDFVSDFGPENIAQRDVLHSSLHAAEESRKAAAGDVLGESVEFLEKSSGESAFSRSALGHVKREIPALVMGAITQDNEIEAQQCSEDDHGVWQKQGFCEDGNFAIRLRLNVTTALSDILSAIHDRATGMFGSTVLLPMHLAPYATRIVFVPVIGILLLLTAQMYLWATVAPQNAEVIAPVSRDEFVPITVIPVAFQPSVNEEEQPNAFQVTQGEPVAIYETSYAQDMSEALQSNFQAVWMLLGVARSHWPQEVPTYLAPLGKAAQTASKIVRTWAVEAGHATERLAMGSAEIVRAYYEPAREAAGLIGEWSIYEEWVKSAIACKLRSYFDSSKVSLALAGLPEAAAEAVVSVERWVNVAAHSGRVYFEACVDAARLTYEGNYYKGWGFTMRQTIVDFVHEKISAGEKVANFASQTASYLRGAQRKLAQWRGWDRIRQKVSSLTKKRKFVKTVGQDAGMEHAKQDFGAQDAMHPAVRNYVQLVQAQAATIWAGLTRRSKGCGVACSVPRRFRELKDGVLARIPLAKERVARIWAWAVGRKETAPPNFSRSTILQQPEGEKKEPLGRSRRHNNGADENLGQAKQECRPNRAALMETVHAAFAALWGHLV